MSTRGCGSGEVPRCAAVLRASSGGGHRPGAEARPRVSSRKHRQNAHRRGVRWAGAKEQHGPEGRSPLASSMGLATNAGWRGARPRSLREGVGPGTGGSRGADKEGGGIGVQLRAKVQGVGTRVSRRTKAVTGGSTPRRRPGVSRDLGEDPGSNWIQRRGLEHAQPEGTMGSPPGASRKVGTGRSPASVALNGGGRPRFQQSAPAGYGEGSRGRKSPK